jgi:hypothetical protein
MATEQLPNGVYLIGQKYAIDGYEVIDAKASYVEDGEDKADADGQHKARINYSRRQTLALELEALGGVEPATPSEYVEGGEIPEEVFTLADGATDTAWNIRSATEGRTRGVATLTLDLIQQGDMLDPE